MAQSEPSSSSAAAVDGPPTKKKRARLDPQEMDAKDSEDSRAYVSAAAATAASAVWQSAAAWICSHPGGYVHPSLSLGADRSVRTSVNLAEGTELMIIPDDCLLTAEPRGAARRLGEEFAEDLRQAVDRAYGTTTEETTARPQGLGSVSGTPRVRGGLRHGRDDVLLALDLAASAELLPSAPSSSSGKSSSILSSSEGSAPRPPIEYLSTLPPSASFDALPRRWPDAELERLLTGTSLLRRARDDRNGLWSDYRMVRDSFVTVRRRRRRESGSGGGGEEGKDDAGDWKEEGKEGRPSFPSYESFDDMFAAVSSRGFAGLGGKRQQSDGGNRSIGEDVDAMVPLLDLLDHRRGSDSCRDVRYYRAAPPMEDSDAKGEGEGAIGEGGEFLQAHVCVMADRNIAAGSVLHDTYGAKGNAQLLSRYGFCVEDNVEPDGSWNDVLEFSPFPKPPSLPSSPPSHSDAHDSSSSPSPIVPVIDLRVGPKSYSYGGFARALEVFHAGRDAGAGGGDGQEQEGEKEEGEGGDDDMETFLDQSDDDELEICGMIYGKEDEKDEGKLGSNAAATATAAAAVAAAAGAATRRAECDALAHLVEALDAAVQSYGLRGEDLESALREAEERKAASSPAYYAAVLVQSEVRTLGFFREAARRIGEMLSCVGRGDVSTKGGRSRGAQADRLDKHVDELVVAFLAIRHPEFATG